MKVLVTGANSHLGIALCNALQGHNICACVREGADTSTLPIGTIVRNTSLEYPESYVSAIKWFKPDVVYHLAWFGSVRGRQSDFQITVNVPASVEIARAAVSVGAAMVFAGSLAENDSVPSLYATAKTCAAKLIQSLYSKYSYGFAWVKLATVYGPHDDERHLIPTLMNSLLEKQRVSLTTGVEKWDYIYVEDAAKAMIEVSGRTGVYEVGFGESTSIKELVEVLASVTGAEPECGWGDYPTKIHSDKKARIAWITEDTLWYPTTVLSDGLKYTWDWFKASKEAE